MKIRVQLDGICPFWLMAATRYLFLDPRLVFGSKKQEQFVNLLRHYARIFQLWHQKIETVFGIIFSRCQMSKSGEILPQEILVHGQNVIYYERDSHGKVYQLLFDSAYMEENLKIYNRFSGPEHYSFWVASLSIYLQKPLPPLSKFGLRDISKICGRSIEVYSFSNDLPKLLYAEYTGKMETPLRVIQPFPDNEAALIIYNPQILDVLPLSVSRLI